jgi:GGDEF domain-containing protein
MDIGNFKAVNDTSGNNAGNIQLKQIFKTAGESAAVPARMGGDEFMILFLASFQDICLRPFFKGIKY